MTTVNPVVAPQTQTTSFRAKKVNVSKVVDKLSKRDIIPMKIIDQMNSPISRAVYEGRSKEEIKEMVIRDIIDFQFAKLSDKYGAEIAKLAAKNGYKG